jgi:hypothetical protein
LICVAVLISLSAPVPVLVLSPSYPFLCGYETTNKPNPNFLFTYLSLSLSLSLSPSQELDYRRRVGNYETTYEPLDTPGGGEENYSYFKCDHSRHHFVVHRVRGYLPLKLVHFIMNLRTTSHAFYLSRYLPPPLSFLHFINSPKISLFLYMDGSISLSLYSSIRRSPFISLSLALSSRHGQSEYNAIGRIGGDSGLSTHGVNYAKKLAEFVEENIVKDKGGEVCFPTLL